jgi:AcrR family transcriptional regulator
MGKPTAWERQRTAVRAEITATARELFVRQGFDATTVDQIVDAAGISRRSFFRYFGTKEDVVLGDVGARGTAIARALAARPLDEGPWEALRGALVDSQPETFDDPASDLAIGQIMSETPSLRARLYEKRTGWHEALIPLVTARIAGPDSNLVATAIVAAALSCFDIAAHTWLDSNGNADITEVYDAAVRAIRT